MTSASPNLGGLPGYTHSEPQLHPQVSTLENGTSRIDMNIRILCFPRGHIELLQVIDDVQCIGRKP